MAELNQIDVATKRFLRKSPDLIDMWSQQGPLVAFLKKNVQENYDGGRAIFENFTYKPMIGGAYAQGKEFNTDMIQVEQALQFNVKFFQVGISMTKEDVQVINKGPNACFKLIESRMQTAYSTIGQHLEIGMFLNGQAANYTTNFNGLAEALNDNSTASFDGSTYATYGTITRGGTTGTALNSIPINVAGTIEYNTLEENYSAASLGNGDWEPNVILTTFLGFSYIKEKFQPQQQFGPSQDLTTGINGLKKRAC